jgi:hypothetical protein
MQFEWPGAFSSVGRHGGCVVVLRLIVQRGLNGVYAELSDERPDLFKKLLAQQSDFGAVNIEGSLEAPKQSFKPSAEFVHLPGPSKRGLPNQ